MKMRVADYIADFLSNKGIKTVFMVPGGGAMHLNDALGHHPKLNCILNHHEQACAMAAEGYVKINNEIPLVCLTSGPGGTNALTGVMGAWVDSIPMLIISGQVKFSTTVKSTGLNLRSFGDQEFDIIKAASSMTKYSEMVTDPFLIKYHLEKALYIAQTGRPGPCWLDIPLNVQGDHIDVDNLQGFDIEEYKKTFPPVPSDEIITKIIEKIKHAKRPVLYAGSGIRLAGGYDLFHKVKKILNIPVVTTMNSIDAVETDDELYAGRAGNMGDRPGNFAVQNSDLVIALGCRMSIRQVSYNFETWARAAYTIVVDIDNEELKKPTVRIDMPVYADIRDVLKKINEKHNDEKIFKNNDWIKTCQKWREKYPVVLNDYYRDGFVNPYCLAKELSIAAPEETITIVGNGTATVACSQANVIKKGSRFIMNSGSATMGYDLPASIGACLANDRKMVICVTGEGSIQMNLQELQTIIHHKLPIKIFLINNDGYHSMRQTNGLFFKEKKPFGIGKESGDISFPDFEKLAYAYGFPYVKCDDNKKVIGAIEQSLKIEGACICEFFVDITQKFEPKSSSKQLDDGRIISPPLEDLAPFLDREELKENMVIPLVNNEE